MQDHRSSIQQTTRALHRGRRSRLVSLVLAWTASLAASDIANADRIRTGRSTWPPTSSSVAPALPVYTDRPVNGSSQQIMALGEDAGRRVWMTTSSARATGAPNAESQQTFRRATARAAQVLPASYRASGTRAARRNALAPLIDRVARAHGIETTLLLAIVDVESGFNTNAVSSMGARGLGQVMPATAARYGKFNLFSPEENLTASSLYLRDLLKLFDGDVRLAVAAYNAGEGAVQRYGNRVPPYAETRQYVPVALARYDQYRREHGPTPRKVVIADHEPHADP